MTEFMIRVADALEDPSTAQPAPEVRTSVPRTVGHGAHEMVELRSLAEQLVCEANAVLAPVGREILLEDETGSEHLAFVLRTGKTWARIVTCFEDRQSFGQLVTSRYVGPRYELVGPEALPDLIVALVTASEHPFVLPAQA